MISTSFDIDCYMRKTLLINEQLTLLSERSSIRGNSYRASMVTTECPGVRAYVKPSRRALHALSDKASMVPDKSTDALSRCWSVPMAFGEI